MPTSRPKQTHSTLGEILEFHTDIEGLKDEMEEWRDNMPESLQSSDKYSQVEEAADTLGNAASELEEACEGIKKILEGDSAVLSAIIEYTEQKMYKGYNMPRWVRLANPCAALGAVVEFLKEQENNIKKSLQNEEDRDQFSYCIDHIDDALSDLSGVEFPPMFG